MKSSLADNVSGYFCLLDPGAEPVYCPSPISIALYHAILQVNKEATCASSGYFSGANHPWRMALCLGPVKRLRDTARDEGSALNPWQCSELCNHRPEFLRIESAWVRQVDVQTRLERATPVDEWVTKGSTGLSSSSNAMPDSPVRRTCKN